MICVQVDTNTGALLAVAPQPVDVSSCELIVISGAEWGGNWANLSPENGVQLSVAVLTVWAFGWVCRQAIRAFNVDEKEGEV